VPSLDSRIDELYQKPLDEFTAARNALAKTLSGDDAQSVRKLAKPTVVPWAVNQLYWHDRRAYDRLLTSGARLRAAQIAALKGRSKDLRSVADAHRNAIAEAAQHATRIAAQAGSSPNPDELTRTLEALSLAPELPEPPGRLTRPLQPAGFEALAGVVPAAMLARAQQQREQEPSKKNASKPSAAERRLAEQEARRMAAEVQRAEVAVERAAAVETKLRQAWERAKRAADEARARLESVRRNPSRSS
jgi:hypothetical protein